MDELVVIPLVLFLIYLAIAVHELGHYLAWRQEGVPVQGFYVGAPPWIFRFRRGGTEYGLGLIPFFGAVLAREEDTGHLTRRGWLKVYLSGPLFSLLAALLGVVLWLLVTWDLERALKAVGVILKAPVVLVVAIFQLLSGGLPEAGFLPLFQASRDLLNRSGPEGVFLLFTALNTVGFWFNLLPIPPLDGGQALYRLFAGSPWVERLYPYALGFGVVFLLVLLGLALLKDAMRLARWWG